MVNRYFIYFFPLLFIIKLELEMKRARSSDSLDLAPHLKLHVTEKEVNLGVQADFLMQKVYGMEVMFVCYCSNNSFQFFESQNMFGSFFFVYFSFLKYFCLFLLLTFNLSFVYFDLFTF